MNWKEGRRKIDRYISFSNNDRPFVEKFGNLIEVGRLSSYKDNSERRQNHKHFAWIIEKDNDIVQVLPRLLPHLETIRKKRAKILLEFSRSRLHQMSKTKKSRVPYTENEFILFKELRKTYKEGD